MKLTRKDFLKSSAILTGGIFLPGFKFLSPLQDQKFRFVDLTKNIGIFIERGGTIGYYATNDALIVIDSQNPETAKNLIDGLKQKTNRKIDLLFNTHHHGDHTSGNTYLKDFANKIVAHENSKMLQEKNYGNNPERPQTYPTATFTNTWSEDLGKERVTAKYFGLAHTGGDSVIHFENANIAHLGDLVFNKTYPVIDPKGGGDLKGWFDVLGKLIKHFSKDTIFIFGHAASDELLTGKINDVKEMQNYIAALLEFVSTEMEKGKTKEEIINSPAIPGFENLKERWQGAKKMNLERAYDYLKGE
ncbi:MAG: MBL fold metallo-hydrolase [Melioribacteraceae bacterium]|nr:MBL fold metallo-hydrolase [Melioribacteraceae bacterium]